MKGKKIMRKYLSLVAVLTVLAWVVSPAYGVTIDKLPLEQQASLGANWGVTFTHADLTTTATNTAQSFTNTFKVLAKQSVRFIGMQLNTAFDGTNSLYTNSLVVIVGDGTDDDLYLASTELHADGTEVWRKFAPANAGTVALTPQFGTVTNGGSTWYCWTNATAAFTAAALGEKVYTADDYIDFKFTPSGAPEAGEAVAETSSGSVTFYFDIQPSK